MDEELIADEPFQDRVDDVAKHLRVVRGKPTDEELAAVIVAVAASGEHRDQSLYGRRLASGPNLWSANDRLGRSSDLGHGYR